MDSCPTLGYWDTRGFVAPIRYVLHYSGVRFTDYMYGDSERASATKEDYQTTKFNMGMDFPNLPYLWDGDLKITEMDAVMHYICTKWNKDLLGKNCTDSTRVRMLESLNRDLRKAAYFPVFGDKHEIEVFEPALEPLGKNLDFMKKNNTQFLAADYVTFVDFQFFEICNWLCHVIPEKANREDMFAYQERMKNLPGFKEVWADDSKTIKMPFTPGMAWIGNK